MLSPRRAAIAGQWVLLGAAVGVACGLASAFFLTALEWVTHFRTGHEGIVYWLPVAGLVIGVLYSWLGGSIKGGYNLVLDTLHTNGKQVPLRMAPMVLIGTVLTHLFGGSAGREGTAVQMGASLADGIAHALGLKGHTRRQLLAAGIAGGFGSVFGTPIAGTMFALEVVCLGRIEYDALLPALVAAVIGDLTTRAVGVKHTPYPQPAALALTPAIFGKWIVFGLVVGLVTMIFVELLHRLKKVLEKRVALLPLRMMIGGIAVVAMWKIVGTSDYLGLGVPTILRSFTDPDLPRAAFAWKLVFTAVTLGAGFLGGEVTPLFFVGAALGNVLARALGLPIESRRRHRARGRLRRRGQHADRAVDHGRRAARGQRLPPRRHRRRGRVHRLRPPEHLPVAADRARQAREQAPRRGAAPRLGHRPGRPRGREPALRRALRAPSERGGSGARSRREEGREGGDEAMRRPA